MDVNRLHGSATRRPDARVGTVDKFQGQKAPVVIYSMATSRAKNVVVIVAFARLIHPECSSPRQMKLANARCRYRELGWALELLPPRP